MLEKEILTLGIESSCDETSAAVLRGGRTILSNVISTQIPIHQKFGGVVPEIASRKHIVNIMPVIDEAVRQAGVTLKDIDQVAVTYGPGLVGACSSASRRLRHWPLRSTSRSSASTISRATSLRTSSQQPTLEPPFMALVVSGGHTALVDVRGYDSFHMMGQTRDDAAGEAFDKIARVMGLPYPGGPRIDALAKEGDPLAIDFPARARGEGQLRVQLQRAQVGCAQLHQQREDEGARASQGRHRGLVPALRRRGARREGL